MEKLNAITLKNKLWETMNEIGTGELEAAKGDAMASQAREILRTIKTQVVIIDMAREQVSDELKDFAVPKI